MRKVRCEKGHFFDADANAFCPHCGFPEEKKEKEKEIPSDDNQESSSKSKKGLFSWKKSEKNDRKEDVSDQKKREDGVSRSNTEKENKEKTNREREIEAVDKADVEEKENSARERNTLQQMSAANGNEKTYSIWSKKNQQDDSDLYMEDEATPYVVEEGRNGRNFRDINDLKTVSKYAGQGGAEPVTGWLVCVSGINYGKAFQLKSGQSTIGRDNSMDICIKDEGITRERHAFVIFEPKKKQFLLRGGDGSGLTYLNDELVTGMVPMNSYDRIQLGDAEFLFVPFCGERFMWDENTK